jgi:hypothetical protein
MVRNGLIRLAMVALAMTPAAAQTPAPFPRPGQSRPPAPPAQPAPAPSPAPPPATATSSAPQTGEPGDLGVPIHPDAQFIASYDAGRGQRYYLFGADSDFLQIVAWYKTMLKQKGELVFDEPAVHMFDIGKYKEETMAFTPSVTVKDYTWAGSLGYLNPKRGGTPARFKTIIQVVPNPPGAPR